MPVSDSPANLPPVKKKLCPVNELFSKNLLTKLVNMNFTYYDESAFCFHNTEMLLTFLPFIISFSALTCDLSPST